MLLTHPPFGNSAPPKHHFPGGPSRVYVDTITDESLFLSVSASFAPGCDLIHTKEGQAQQHGRKQ